MLRSYSQTKELYFCVLRVPKDDAYFVYFTFEANEGLCSFSTREESLKGQYRDIAATTSIELKELLLALIRRLQQEIRLDVIEEKILSDS